MDSRDCQELECSKGDVPVASLISYVKWEWSVLKGMFLLPA